MDQIGEKNGDDVPQEINTSRFLKPSEKKKCSKTALCKDLITDTS